MEVINGLDFQIKKSAVTLGKFEGIHRGHRLLLNAIREQKRLVPTVFTFDRILAGKRIYTGAEQSRILEKLGIAREIIFPFCEETKAMSAEQFVEQILIEKMDTKFICVGEDFHFGKNRQGDVELLYKLSGRFGYDLQICPKLQEGGEIISSSRIRREMMKGSIDRVNQLLGEPYFISGRVVHGKKLGRRMDMPTANIDPGEDKLLPSHGVYAVMAESGGRCYPGVANLGIRPTVGGEKVNLETTLLDFSGNLYDEELVVYFHAYIRPEKRFENMGQLKEQITKDKEWATQFFKNQNYRLKQTGI